jgi:hypothetical protein
MMKRIAAVLVAAATVTIGAAQAPNLESVGPKVGTAVPAFGGVDQFGRSQTLESLAGRDGLMLVFFRSADW